MPDQSATVCLSRTITVASGLFAPGHLGELTEHVPFDLVDAVLAETGTVQRRLRLLPSRVGVYFLLALGMFPQVGYLRVWEKLTAGLAGLSVARPSERALRDLRRRLGPAPLRELFGVLAVAMAGGNAAGVCYRRWRTVAFDGCSSIKAPDSGRVRAWLGRGKGGPTGWAGYPVLQLVALVETGTRGLLGAVFGPTGSGEVTYAGDLVPLLDARHLLLADRGFDSTPLMHKVHATGAKFLIRLRTLRQLPVLARLDDGSFLTRIGTVPVRIIEAEVTMHLQDGTVTAHRYRLATTLLDPGTDPAEALIGLYHERWEIESAFYALRHTLMRGRVLRSRDREGIEQELWAVLVLYQVLRHAMADAVRAERGVDVDRASFTVALETARDRLVAATGILPENACGQSEIAKAVRANLLPPRRARTSARRVKSPVSRYRAAPGSKPSASTAVTAIDITILTATSIAERPDHGPLRNRAGEDQARIHRVYQLMTAEPHRQWGPAELAHLLGITNVQAFSTQVGKWARQGLLAKPTRGKYTLAEQHVHP